MRVRVTWSGLSCLALASSVLAACEGAPHVLGTEETPLFVVRGRISGTVPPSPNLRVGIVWAGVPVYVPYCHDRGPTPLDPRRSLSLVAQNGCRDPLDVVPALAGPSLPLDPGVGTFELPIAHLPDASVMVGRLPSRVAYGTVVIYDDLDGNGTLDFAGPCGADAGGRDSTGSTLSEVTQETEPIYAASFSTLRREQTRIAYVEGPFDGDSYYYPHPRCTVLPPAGFSLWVVGDLRAADDTCRLAAPEDDVVLEGVDTYLLDHLSCPQGSRDAFPRPPPRRLPSDRFHWECTPEGGMAVSSPYCACPNLRVYQLRGCYADAACETPDWDVPAPPEWPCIPTGGP